MKSEEEFNSLYENLLQPKVTQIDNERKVKVKKLVRTILGFTLLPIPAILIVINLINNTDFSPNNNPAAGIAGAIIAYYIIMLAASGYSLNRKSEFYSSEMKNLIIPEIIKFYGVDLKYEFYRGIMDKTIEISNLFDGFNSSDNNDYIEGPIDKTFIQFSNCVLITSGRNVDKVVFKGVFLVATFNKNFKGQYLVLPGNHSIPYVDVPGEGLVKTEEIKLENPDFTSHFSVFGTDQVEARYILSPAMMQHMLDFGYKINNDVYFAFARNHFFVAFATKTGKFEPRLYSPLVNEEVKEWCRNIHNAISVVDDFSLNEHLWNKP